MAKLIGGIVITRTRWASASAIRVEFTSNNTGFNHQLYYGRRLIAETVNTTQRTLTGQINGGRWQDQLTVLAVSSTDVGNDHGGDLPPGAYNVAKVNFDASGFPSDTDKIEVFSGDEPGGAVNTTTPIEVIPFEGAKTYQVFTKPLKGSGTWNFEVRGVDNRPSTGNAGTAATASVSDVVAAPPDFDTAFTASVSSAVLTATATIPED